MKLIKEEVDAIPVLLLLRRLDVLIHFLGRYMDGVDEKQIVTDQIASVYSQIQWLEENEKKLSDVCRKLAV